MLSQFDLEIKYLPGPENVVADASSASEDLSAHGSKEACEEIERMMQEELLERKDVAMV